MSVKAKVEAIIYATEEPVTLNQLASLLKDAVLSEMRAEEDARLALNETVADIRVAETNEDVGLPEEVLADGLESVADGAVPGSAGTGERPSYYEGTQIDPGDLTKDQKADRDKQQLHDAKARVSEIIDQLIAEYSASDRGMEIRQIAGGYRMATKPEHHDVVVNFARSLKPPVRLSLQALETLAVIAYKQPVTVPEISEVRGVDAAGVIATLLDRKLVTTAGRKQVIGRPILYKTTKEFLLRFGLKDIAELPSVEEFEKLGDPQAELFTAPAPPSTAEAGLSSHATDAVTEADPELVSDANRETESFTAVESSAMGQGFEPVTEAVPQLATDRNREGHPDPVAEEANGHSGQKRD